MIVVPKDLPRCLVDGLLLIKSSGGDGGGDEVGNPFELQCSIVVPVVVVVVLVVTLLSITSSAVLDERHSESSSLVS